MVRWLILALIVVPLVELYLLVRLSAAIGFAETVAVAVITGIVGGNLARREGLRVWHSWQAALREGRVPKLGVVEGLLILVGAVLLLTPGVLTDVVGLSLLVPATRRPLAAWLSQWTERRLRSVNPGMAGAYGYSSRDVRGAPTTDGSEGARVTVVDTAGEEVRDPEPNTKQLDCP